MFEHVKNWLGAEEEVPYWFAGGDKGRWSRCLRENKPKVVLC